MKLILASKSQRRSDLLRKLGYCFEVVPANVREIESGIYPPHIPIANAIAKANAVAAHYPDDLVLGADTVIELDGKVIGKPADPADAEKIIRNLSGRTHAVISGICLLCRKENMQCVFSDTTEVIFKKLSGEAVSEYLGKVYVLDKAGAYAIQEYGEMLIENIAGSLDNVIGLPSERVKEFLDYSGYGCRVSRQ